MIFETIWETSKYNWAFWLSHILGILGVSALLFFAFRIKSQSKRKIIYMITIIVMSIFITASTILSVQIKWERRCDAAQTKKEKTAVANRDGANLTFSPIIGGFKSLIYVGIGMIALIIIQKIKLHQDRIM
jgi:Na+/melibiose symporter-like transporter